MPSLGYRCGYTRSHEATSQNLTTAENRKCANVPEAPGTNPITLLSSLLRLVKHVDFAKAAMLESVEDAAKIPWLTPRRKVATVDRKAENVTSTTRWRQRARSLQVAAGIAALWLSLAATAQVQSTKDDTEIARVGDIVVTLGDLDDAWRRNDAASRTRLLQQLYETRRRALDIVIGEHLIEREASARGVTRKELLAEELPSRVRLVTDAEVELIYERNQNAFQGRTFDQMRPEIRAALEQQGPEQALHQFMRELRDRAIDVAVMLDPPRQGIEILPEDPSRGPEDAAVVMVEFSDFQCPYCQRVTNTLADLMERYDGQIRFVYKDYPLPSHPEAFKAAEAGNCAHEQGKFWEFHDKLFASQGSLDVGSLKMYAGELELDSDSFSHCLDDGRYSERVQQDLRIGQQYGVSSTPTVFINGRAVTGAVSIETFDTIIQEELASFGP